MSAGVPALVFCSCEECVFPVRRTAARIPSAHSALLNDYSMQINISRLSLVGLIGSSGSGKSTFARRNLSLSEVLSSYDCRGLVTDNENDQAATNNAFDELHYVVAKRLAQWKLWHGGG
jgi:ABC-type phosphate transport system ATPase subunit